VNAGSKDQERQLLPSGGAKRTARKPYVKPEVRHERVFETRALSCGKIGVTSFSCAANRRSS